MRAWLDSLSAHQRSELRRIIGSEHYDPIKRYAEPATMARPLRRSCGSSRTSEDDKWAALGVQRFKASGPQARRAWRWRKSTREVEKIAGPFRRSVEPLSTKPVEAMLYDLGLQRTPPRPFQRCSRTLRSGVLTWHRAARKTHETPPPCHECSVVSTTKRDLGKLGPDGCAHRAVLFDEDHPGADGRRARPVVPHFEREQADQVIRWLHQASSRLLVDKDSIAPSDEQNPQGDC
jgi:hypothetical protein